MHEVGYNKIKDNNTSQFINNRNLIFKNKNPFADSHF